MPQEDKSAKAPHATLEGTTYEPKNQAELLSALDIALDYRGDVTVVLKDTTKIEGYLFRVDPKDDKFYIFVKQGKDSVEATHPISTVASIIFTGDDPAFGKSWDDWAKKGEAQRAAEAERARIEAEKLGHL